MKDIVKIILLEEEADKLLQKTERLKKHNAEKGRIGREGMFDQIENIIKIDQNRREEILEELKSLKKGDK